MGMERGEGVSGAATRMYQSVALFSEGLHGGVF